MDSFLSLIALVPPPVAGKLVRLRDDREERAGFGKARSTADTEATPAVPSQCMDCRRCCKLTILCEYEKLKREKGKLLPLRVMGLSKQPGLLWIP
jgi:hypothetical protein